MKKISIALSIILMAFIANAQNFEGEIIYKNSFVSKLPNLPSEKLESLLGTRQEYFVKDGYYKSVTNGRTLAMQLYDNKTNRLYNKLAGLHGHGIVFAAGIHPDNKPRSAGVLQRL